MEQFKPIFYLKLILLPLPPNGSPFVDHQGWVVDDGGLIPPRVEDELDCSHGNKQQEIAAPHESLFLDNQVSWEEEET